MGQTYRASYVEAGTHQQTMCGYEITEHARGGQQHGYSKRILVLLMWQRTCTMEANETAYIRLLN